MEGRESLINRIEDRNGLHVLESVEQIGLRTRSYQLGKTSGVIQKVVVGLIELGKLSK